MKHRYSLDPILFFNFSTLDITRIELERDLRRHYVTVIDHQRNPLVYVHGKQVRFL